MPPIHIHSCLLAQHRPLLREAGECLSADELDRCARFKADTARDEFVLSRILLRRTLAAYLNQPAEHIALARNPFGKPQLAPDGHGGLEFNIAHSHGRLLMAICRGLPVGIDIERIDPAIDPILLARNGLAKEDLQELEATPEDRRHALFFQRWTRWEAYLKALGEGFSHGAGNPSRIDAADEIQVWEAPEGGRRVLIRDLPVAGDFKAAVAVATKGEPPATLEIQWHDTVP